MTLDDGGVERIKDRLEITLPVVFTVIWMFVLKQLMTVHNVINRLMLAMNNCNIKHL